MTINGIRMHASNSDVNRSLSRRVLSTSVALILMIGIATSAAAQGSDDGAIAPLPKNSLYLEVGGSGLIYSINYDRVIQDRFSVRAGAAVYGDSGFFVPVLGNYLLGKGNSRLELGLGIAAFSITFGFFDSEEEVSRILGTASFAYRYQKPGGGIFGKAGFTPLFNGSGVLPWFGASIGYTLD